MRRRNVCGITYILTSVSVRQFSRLEIQLMFCTVRVNISRQPLAGQQASNGKEENFNKESGAL